MEPAPYLWSLTSEILIVLLILVSTGLFLVVHRKNLLALLVDKQSELIDKLRAEPRSETVNDRAAYHIRDTAKWIQTRYRVEYGAATNVANVEFDELGQQRVEMLVAMQALGRELQAYKDQLEPDASWAEIQPALNKVLAPLYAAAVETVPVVSEVAEPDAVVDVAEWEEKLAAEQQRTRELEQELLQARSVHQELLDGLNEKTRGSNELSERKEDRDGNVELIRKDKASSEHGQREDIMNKALADSLQKNEMEMKNLRNALAGQHELVAKLKYKLSKGDGSAAVIESADLESLSRMLKESDTCIQTLEMDLEQTHAQIAQLEQELNDLKSTHDGEDEVTRDFIKKSAQETKEMLGCIRTLEDTCDSQAEEITHLEEQLRIVQEEKESFKLRLIDYGEVFATEEAESGEEAAEETGSDSDGLDIELGESGESKEA